MPVAVEDIRGAVSGREVSDIIRNDLDFTGFFKCLDSAAFIEGQDKPFNPGNWTVIGAEAVMKGVIREGAELVATITLYDVSEAREVLKKEYSSDKNHLRQLAHSISNDIYKTLTGREGVFKTRVAFVAGDENKKGLYIMDWDGGRIKKLGIRGDLVLPPHWSADGKMLLYSSERDRQWGIYLLDFARMTERKVFSARGINIVGGFFPAGDEFVLSSSKDGTPDIYSFNLNENRLTRMTSTRGINISPAVSPDGSSIAFVSDRGGSPQIYIMDSKGYSARRLTYEGSYNTSPGWSPSGDRILFIGRRSRNQVFTIKPDGSGLTQLTEHGNNEDASFSPDGRYIVFSSDRSGEKAVYIMRANGEAQRRITPKGLASFGPKWSAN